MALFSCNNEPEGSQAHIEAVRLNDSIELLHENILEQIKDMKSVLEKLEDKITDQEISDSSIFDIILLANTDIATCEGIAKKHKVILDQQKGYIKAHENSALSVDKINMQHDQIQKDYYTVRADVLEVNRLYSELYSKAKNYTELD